MDADRYRAWVLFLVDDPQAATSAINSPDSEEQYPLKKGGVDYVIVRADIVSDDTNGDFNLVVPVDAEGAAGFEAALGELKSVIGADPARILRVVAHTPWPPHCSDTVVTQGELEGFYLKEYDPAGRHPHSPGANPWG